MRIRVGFRIIAALKIGDRAVAVCLHPTYEVGSVVMLPALVIEHLSLGDSFGCRVKIVPGEVIVTGEQGYDTVLEDF